ncbi:hypothetical protein FA09DRAFT_246836 [Tilletiopsis washingtonensis]|jgi:hypothetical protein|uniref:Uncharacterized protein n=1 Tax=Tilletiopsis washingtonensis TaxID=58919 RepID=A0A316ZAE2_9BASI|nr:hypothetical protein FA09DRAFT_246836 [Tilletiopsis washingtonensis]PWN98650.1 hypothetical protein FA09DRAFT_246836 [Tilletiopsis washingtonensis]
MQRMARHLSAVAIVEQRAGESRDVKVPDAADRTSTGAATPQFLSGTGDGYITHRKGGARSSSDAHLTWALERRAGKLSEKRTRLSIVARRALVNASTDGRESIRGARACSCQPLERSCPVEVACTAQSLLRGRHRSRSAGRSVVLPRASLAVLHAGRASHSCALALAACLCRRHASLCSV